MSYQADYEGAQMDAAWKRILDTTVGSAEDIAPIAGYINVVVRDVGKHLKNPNVFVTLRTTDGAGLSGDANVVVSYNDGFLQIWARGDGIESGERYRFDYMLIE